MIKLIYSNIFSIAILPIAFFVTTTALATSVFAASGSESQQINEQTKEVDPFEAPDSFFEKTRKKIKFENVQNQNFSCRASCILTSEKPLKNKPLYILHTEVMIEANSAESGIAALRNECHGNDEKLVHTFEKGFIKDDKSIANTNLNTKLNTKKTKNLDLKSTSGEEYVISTTEASAKNSCITSNISHNIEKANEEQSKIKDSGSVGASVLEAE